MYELIVLWSTGERDVFEYETKEDAAKGADNMRMAFGNQIQWTGIESREEKEHHIGVLFLCPILCGKHARH